MSGWLGALVWVGVGDLVVQGVGGCLGGSVSVWVSWGGYVCVSL